MASSKTIKLILGSQVCPVHGISPMVDIEGHDIKILCCCALFYEQCTKEAASLFMLNREYPYWTISETVTQG